VVQHIKQTKPPQKQQIATKNPPWWSLLPSVFMVASFISELRSDQSLRRDHSHVVGPFTICDMEERAAVDNAGLCDERSALQKVAPKTFRDVGKGGSGTTTVLKAHRPDEDPWREMVDEKTGQPFLYNVRTGKSQWTKRKPSSTPSSAQGASTEIPEVLQRENDDESTGVLLPRWLTALGIDSADAEGYVASFQAAGVTKPQHVLDLTPETLDEVALKKAHRQIIASKIHKAAVAFRSVQFQAAVELASVPLPDAAPPAPPPSARRTGLPEVHDEAKAQVSLTPGTLLRHILALKQPKNDQNSAIAPPTRSLWGVVSQLTGHEIDTPTIDACAHKFAVFTYWLFAIATAVILLFILVHEQGSVFVNTFFVMALATIAYRYKCSHLAEIKFKGKHVPIVRYLDWLFTTPIMLYELCHIAHADQSTTVLICGLDIIMLVCGICSAVADAKTHFRVKSQLFIFACVAYVLMIYQLRTKVSRGSAQQQPEHIRNLFSNLEALMIVTWSFYPFAVGLGRAHAGLISTHAEDVLICALDAIAKVGMEGLVLYSVVSMGGH
jgi:bacteriorhodopsin